MEKENGSVLDDEKIMWSFFVFWLSNPEIVVFASFEN